MFSVKLILTPAFSMKQRCIYTVYHYAKTPMQYTVIFHGSKIDNFQVKHYEIFKLIKYTFVEGVSGGHLLS